MVDRPLIQHVVDEAREAGIEHFIFVTGRNKAVIEDHFDRQFELELTLKERNKHADLKLLSRDLPEPGTASFTRQQSPLGLGHAVWCARELVGHEPFALLLPDVLVQHKPGCLEQMIDAYNAAERERQRHRGRGSADGPHPHYGVVGVGKAKGKTFAITEHGGEAAAREGAVQPHHHRPLHPAAGDLRSAGDADRRRRRRNPDHRFDDQARQDAAVLRLEVRRHAASTAAPRSASSPPMSPMRWSARHRAGVPRKRSRSCWAIRAPSSSPRRCCRHTSARSPSACRQSAPPSSRQPSSADAARD